MSKKILVLTYGYPSKASSTRYTFVKVLVDNWRAQGIDVTVVCPMIPKTYFRNVGYKSEKEIYPLYFEYRPLKLFPFMRKLRARWAKKSFTRACMKCVPEDFDGVIYSHFLNAGISAADIAEKMGLSSYCAVGESTLWSIRDLDESFLKTVFYKVTGFIAVSSENRKILLTRGFADEKNIVVLPNGVDHNVFKKIDRAEAREMLNLPAEKTIGIFVGAFIDRKGVLRVAEASRGIENLGMLYVGSGEEQPCGDNILFCGRVEHEKLPLYLSAADFFILPTKAEGCCNAIIEAMAAGLPIISSVGEFNDDILDDTMSLRVNPDNIDEIRGGMQKLVNNKALREQMGEAAYRKSEEFDIEVRAKRIAEYIGAI